MRFQDSLNSKEFVITAEIGPPKGTAVEEMLEVAIKLKRHVAAINITDNQSSVMRMSSLAACQTLKNIGIEPILQLTCRDRNRLAIQSDLLGASALGIRNVLCLTGDHASLGDHPASKSVFDLDSVQLLQAVESLNNGRDLGGNQLNGSTDFFAGAVVAPEAKPLEPHLVKFDKKVRAGAKFFQTQAVFSIDNFLQFLEKVKPYDVPILAGILLIKSAGMARFLNRKIPGITVPEEIIKEMDKAKHPVEKGIEIAAKLISELKGACSGVHIMAIGAEEKVLDILEAADLIKKPEKAVV